MKKLILFGIALVAMPAFAQVAQPIWADSILAWLHNLSPSALAAALMVIELVLRLIPSQKSLSVLVPVNYALKSIGQMLAWLSGINILLDVFNALPVQDRRSDCRERPGRDA